MFNSASYKTGFGIAADCTKLICCCLMYNWENMAHIYVQHVEPLIEEKHPQMF